MDYETGKNFEVINEKLDLIISWIASKEQKPKKEVKEEPKVQEQRQKEKETLKKEYDIDDEEL